MEQKQHPHPAWSSGLAVYRTAVGPLLLAMAVVFVVISWIQVSRVGAPPTAAVAGTAVLLLVVATSFRLTLTGRRIGSDVGLLGSAGVALGMALSLGALVVAGLVLVLVVVWLLVRPRRSPASAVEVTAVGQPNAEAQVEGEASSIDTTWADLVARWNADPAGSRLSYSSHFEVKADAKSVFDSCWDVDFLVGCIDGCEGAEEIEPLHCYSATIRKRLGPFLVRMVLQVEVLDVADPLGIVMTASGSDKKLRSDVELHLYFRIAPQRDGSTKVSIQLLARVEGVLASVDEYLVSAQFDVTVTEFVTTFDQALATRTAPATGPLPTEGTHR